MFSYSCSVHSSNKCTFARKSKIMSHRIKEAIKEKGYTQLQFAEKLEMTRGGLIQLLESPSYPSLEKVASALNVPMWQLFAAPDDMQLKSDTAGITCPHCGKNINIKVE